MPVSLETVYDLRHRWDFGPETTEEIRNQLSEELVDGLKKEMQENYEIDGILIKVGDEAFTNNGTCNFIEPVFWYGDTKPANIFDFLTPLSNIYLRTMETVSADSQKAVEVQIDNDRYVVLLGLISEFKETGRKGMVQKILKVSKRADFNKHAKDFFKCSVYETSEVQEGEYQPVDINKRDFLKLCLTPIFERQGSELQIGRHKFKYTDIEGIEMYKLISETL